MGKEYFLPFSFLSSKFVYKSELQRVSAVELARQIVLCRQQNTVCCCRRENSWVSFIQIHCMFTKVKGLVPWRSLAFISLKLEQKKFHILILFQQITCSEQGIQEQAETYSLPANSSNKIALSESVKRGGKENFCQLSTIISPSIW